MGSRLVGDLKEDGKVKQRRDPENHVENQRAKKFRKYYLPVTHRDSRQWLNRAELKFFSKQTHRENVRRESGLFASNRLHESSSRPSIQVRSKEIECIH